MTSFLSLSDMWTVYALVEHELMQKRKELDPSDEYIKELSSILEKIQAFLD